MGVCTGKADSAHIHAVVAIDKLVGSQNDWSFNPRFIEKFAMRMFAVSTVLVFAAIVAGAQERTPSPAGAEVYFISPKDGATVSSPFLVQFGLKGMGVAPAGVKFEHSGHHHLLIDSDPPVDLNAPLTANDQLIHFGKGQTQATVTLPPGKHTLQLLLGDQDHRAHNPPVFSKKITVTVTK
jgi:hypothetical protein